MNRLLYDGISPASERLARSVLGANQHLDSIKVIS
jgi:hypothetical protein